MSYQQLSLFLLILVIVIISVSAASAQIEQQAQKWLTFDRTNYDFKIQYPVYPDLIIRERADSVIFQKLGNSSDTRDDVVVSVNIIERKQDKNDNENLDQFASNLTSRTSSYKVLELEKNATLSGTPAYRVMMISSQGHRESGIFTSKDGIIYSIAYSVAQNNNFDKFLPIAQKMIDSFQITK
jgi:PsbP-like protein